MYLHMRQNGRWERSRETERAEKASKERERVENPRKKERKKSGNGFKSSVPELESRPGILVIL